MKRKPDFDLPEPLPKLRRSIRIEEQLKQQDKVDWENVMKGKSNYRSNSLGCPIRWRKVKKSQKRQQWNSNKNSKGHPTFPLQESSKNDQTIESSFDDLPETNQPMESSVDQASERDETTDLSLGKLIAMDEL